MCLYLNGRQELISKQTVAIGGVNYTSLAPRDVFAPALQLPCCAVILVHNHPSKNCEPSEDDIRVTQILVAAGNLLGINLIDHIIVGGGSHVSLASMGLIQAKLQTQ